MAFRLDNLTLNLIISECPKVFQSPFNEIKILDHSSMWREKVLVITHYNDYVHKVSQFSSLEHLQQLISISTTGDAYHKECDSQDNQIRETVKNSEEILLLDLMLWV